MCCQMLAYAAAPPLVRDFAHAISVGVKAYLRLQAQLLLQLQAEEEQDRRGEALYNLSGGSTPSNAPPTPGQPAALHSKYAGDVLVPA